MLIRSVAAVALLSFTLPLPAAGAACVLELPPYCGLSLEWLAEASESAGIYSIESLRAGEDDANVYRITALLSLCLKGECDQSATQEPIYFDPGPTPGDRLLLFSRSDWSDPFVISLTRPESRPGSAVDRDFRLHRSEESILAVVKDQLEVREREQAPLVRYYPGLRVEVPTSSEAFYELLEIRHGASLVVPMDARQEQLLRQVLAEGVDWLHQEWALCTLVKCYPDAVFTWNDYAHIDPLLTYASTWGTLGVKDQLEIPIRIDLIQATIENADQIYGEAYCPLPAGGMCERVRGITWPDQ